MFGWWAKAYRVADLSVGGPYLRGLRTDFGWELGQGRLSLDSMPTAPP